MAIFTILLLLGVLCLLIGSIVLIVVGFKQSIWWGLAILFIPFSWLIFLVLHWEQGKNGFLMIVTGIIFYVAAFATMPPGAKPVIEALIAARTGQPVPPALSGYLGTKPAPADAKGGAATPAVGKAPTSVSTVVTPVASTPAVVTTASSLETDTQVEAALVELNDRARTLMARKESLKNSTDQPAIFALAEDIKSFNERLKVVTARQAELNQGRAPGAAPVAAAPAASPTPSTPPPAGPVIPPTVVIPAPTPALTPAPKKK